jgi:hypothetical protein
LSEINIPDPHPEHRHANQLRAACPVSRLDIGSPALGISHFDALQGQWPEDEFYAECRELCRQDSANVAALFQRQDDGENGPRHGENQLQQQSAGEYQEVGSSSVVPSFFIH